jgi:hypothetical protein
MKKGSKLVCKIAHVRGKSLPEIIYDQMQFPEVGKIYTIREVVHMPNSGGAEYGVLLEEIVNRKFFNSNLNKEIEINFHLDYFEIPKIKLKVKIPKYEECVCG